MAHKILLIDDDVEFVDAISNLLDAKGYDVETASNGKDGIAKAKQIHPNLIILDVMMNTKTEGFDAAREIHQDSSLKNTPVIMLSGVRKEMNLPFSFEPDEEMLPIRVFLEKPVTPAVLLQTIEENVS